MKTLYLIGIILFYSLITLYAQSDPTVKPVYTTYLVFQKNPLNFKGYLYELKDSSMVLSRFQGDLNPEDYGSLREEFNISQINKIMFRKKKRIGQGALIGGIIGALAGVGIGYWTGDVDNCSIYGGSLLCVEATAKQKAIMGGVLLGVAGAGAGAIIGGAKIKIPINGDMGVYNHSKKRLSKYVIK